ncbi:3'-5' exonuclease family protein [Histomonas meleagridis]|uniref:3'-5' exonuclease family protein n=1 Tax=Histomonas meleagridis TaxID=135588 RepID=UPI00355AC655|nr:3'-5' exonuclease family protein [Histomonas meleagridis]KAH0806218.1 3'-5' exonuclease family protein [Histomonas meleagridis]
MEPLPSQNANEKPEPNNTKNNSSHVGAEKPIKLSFRQSSYSSLYGNLVTKSGDHVNELVGDEQSKSGKPQNPIIVFDDHPDEESTPIGLTYRQPSFSSLRGELIPKGGENSLIDTIQEFPIDEDSENEDIEPLDENDESDPQVAIVKELRDKNINRWKKMGYEPPSDLIEIVRSASQSQISQSERPSSFNPELSLDQIAPIEEETNSKKVNISHKRCGSDGAPLGESSTKIERMSNAILTIPQEEEFATNSEPSTIKEGEEEDTFETDESYNSNSDDEFSDNNEVNEPTNLFGHLGLIVKERPSSPVYLAIQTGDVSHVKDIPNIQKILEKYREQCIDRLWVDEVSYLNDLIHSLSFGNNSCQNSKIEFEREKLRISIELLQEKYKIAAQALDAKYCSNEFLSKYGKPSQTLLSLKAKARELIKQNKIDEAKREIRNIKNLEKKETKAISDRIQQKYLREDEKLKKEFALKLNYIKKKTYAKIQYLKSIGNDEIAANEIVSEKELLNVRKPKLLDRSMVNDKKQLRKKFNSTFSENLEDIAITRLIPYGHSENFVHMTHQFAGIPKAEFKDIKITKSNWEAPTLTVRQVLYAAFDVVALYVAYPNFPPPKQNKSPKQQQIKVKQNNNNNKSENVRNKSKQTNTKKRKTNLKVVLKQGEVKQTFSYICKRYTGNTSHIYLRSLFENYDFISSFPNNDGTFTLIVSLYEELDLNNFSDLSFIKLRQVPTELSTIYDVMYFINIPTRIASQDSLEDFFYCFGFDQLVNYNGEYCRVEPRNVQISHRIRTFLPFFEVDGQTLELYNFPFFLPKLRCYNLPSTFTVNDCMKTFPNITSVEILPSRQESDNKTAFLTFPNIETAELILHEMNYMKINNNELRITRFTDETQIRLMRNYELTVYGFNDSKTVYEHYSKFGLIFQAYYDPILQNSHVQFYSHLDAHKAQDESSFLSPEGYGIVIRDLSFDVTEQQLINLFKDYGTIRNLVFRELYYQSMLSVADVVFSSPEIPQIIKKKFNRLKLCGVPIYVSVRNREDMIDWKMSQKNQWVKLLNPISSIDEIFSKLKHYGKIIDYNIVDNIGYVMFDSQDTVKTIITSENNNCSLITNQEFVYNTNNKDLDIIEVKSIPEVKKDPRILAVVIDPIPECVNEKFVNELCKNCGDYEMYIINSRVCDPDKKRLIVYCFSTRMITKVYTVLLNTEINGIYLRPRKVEISDLKDVPKPTKGIYYFGETQVTHNIIIVDPLPQGWDENEVRKLIEVEKASVIIDKSANVIGQKRAGIITKTCQERTAVLRALARKLPNGEYLHVYKMKPEQIPKPL